VFIGAKMLVEDFVHISLGISLGIVFLILFMSIIASITLGKNRKKVAE
jgi:predicted tellurium resistance membrane protein TerC